MLLPARKPNHLQVKALSLTRKPLQVKAMVSTWKPTKMGVKTTFSTQKPIIINNLASVSGPPIDLSPPTKKGLASFKRNQARLDTGNDANEQLMSKSPLPNDLLSVFNLPVYTPDDEVFISPNRFLKAIATIASLRTLTPNKAPFKFSTDTGSVAFNTQVLHKANNDFVSIIDQNQDTSLSYSSEFRSLPALASIY